MLCNTGWKAKSYLKIFTDILPLLSDLKTMTRFEIKAMLPEGTYVDNHPELEHDIQYIWDAILRNVGGVGVDSLASHTYPTVHGTSHTICHINPSTENDQMLQC
jgi:hypothetical protein